MKARVFFITFLTPFVLYLLVALAALITWSNEKEYENDIAGLELAAFVEDTVSSADALSLRVSEITGGNVHISSADEQLEQFKKKFKVDVMSVLTENPFGPVIFSSLDTDATLAAVKSSVAALPGVRSVAYPDSKRSQIDISYNDRHIKICIVDTVIVFLLILQTWMAVRLEGAANESVMSASAAPYPIKRRTFLRRAFIRGACIGLLSAAVFLALRMALEMNHEVFFAVDFDGALTIAALTVIVSSLLTYLTELMAFPIAYKNSR